MADIKVVQSHLASVVHYLRPLLPLANCHMVNFLTGNFWEKFLTSEMKNEYEINRLSGMYHIFWHSMKYKNTSSVSESVEFCSNAPVLTKYFDNARDMCLGASNEVKLSYNEFQEKLISWGLKEKDEVHIEEFMSPKKTHEVKMMSEVVAVITRKSGLSHIIDVGGGKGYLSSMLALHHGLRVLGVDSSQINTHGAVKRTEKLKKYWPSLCRKAAERTSGKESKRGKHWKAKGKIESCSPEPPEDIVSSDTSAENTDSPVSNFSLYKQTTIFVEETSDVKTLMEKNFPGSSSCQLALVGLHTCGNLAPTCLKLFAQNSSIRTLCNVGCCYHLIEEEFSPNPYTNQRDLSPEHTIEYGFPMSQFLKKQNFALGRNARMLAAQAIDRLSEKEEISVESLFFRALLQVLLFNKFGEDRSDWQVGRMPPKCKSFPEYYNRCQKRLNVDLELSPEELVAFHDNYLNQKNELEAFYLLRVALAPVIEAVVLLDRLLYLLEQDVHEAHLVQLFNPVISPRCYGIVALKNK